FTEEDLNTRLTAMGTKDGSVVVYDSLEKEMVVIIQLENGQSEITAISVSHALMEIDDEKFESFHLVWTVSMDKTVSLTLYDEDEKLTLLSQQKCAVENPRGVYCIEEEKRSSLRVIVVGDHIQTLYFCLKPLFKSTGVEKEDLTELTISNNVID
ncbi:hypothetical protein PENTCL1PPCAC_23103, partial [Pristionchus entomophagus]